MEKQPKKVKTDQKKHRVNVHGSGDQRVTGTTTKRYEEILSDPRLRYIFMVDNLLRALALDVIPVQHKGIVLKFISEFAKSDDGEKIKRLDVYKEDKVFKAVCAIVSTKARERDLPTCPFNTCNLMMNDKAWPTYKRLALQGALRFYLLAHDRLLKDVVEDHRYYVEDMKTTPTSEKKESNHHGVVGTFAQIKLQKEVKGPVTIIDENNIQAAKYLADIHPHITFIFSPRDFLYMRNPIVIDAFAEEGRYPSMNMEFKIPMYKDYTCNIGGKYFITRKGQDDDTVTTSFLSKTLSITYFMNVPRVDFEIKNGEVIMQRGDRTVFGKTAQKDLDISFTAYVSKRIVRIAKLHSYNGVKKDKHYCYHNFEKGLEDFVINNFDITTPTSKPPGYAERHKGYIIHNRNTDNIYYSAYYLHYRVTQNTKLYNYCISKGIKWDFPVPLCEENGHGDLVDYVFDNRYKPPLLKHMEVIESFAIRKSRIKENPYRARDRDFFPTYFDDLLNTYRNAFMLDDIIHSGSLETTDPNHSLKYGSEKFFPYSKDQDPFQSYIRDYYSTICHSPSSTIDSIHLSPQVTISGNRDFKDDDFKGNSYLMDNYVEPNCHELDPDHDVIMNARMYRALIEYNQKMMGESNIQRLFTI